MTVAEKTGLIAYFQVSTNLLLVLSVYRVLYSTLMVEATVHTAQMQCRLARVQAIKKLAN